MKKNERERRRKKREIMEEVAKAKTELDIAYSRFDFADSASFVDVASAGISLAESRFDHAMRKAKGTIYEYDEIY